MRSAIVIGAIATTAAQAQDCTTDWDTSLPGILQGYVGQIIAFDDGDSHDLFVGGSFTGVQGLPTVKLITRIDPDTGDADPVGVGLDPGNVNGFVEGLAVYETDDGPLLVAGGQFHDAGLNVPDTQSLAAWNGQDWISLDAGLVQGNAIFAMAVGDIGDGDRLYIGGNMPTTGGVPTGGVAAWDGKQFYAVGNGIGVEGPFSPFVSAMAIFDDGSGPALYIGGRFDTVDGLPAKNLARWNGEFWSTVGDGVLPLSNLQNIDDMVVADLGDGPALYIVGATFSPLDDPGFVSCAKWDGETLTGIGQDVGGRVTSVEAFDDGTETRLVIGGTATPDIDYLAVLDGDTWVPLAGGVGGSAIPPSNFPSVFGLGLYEGNLVVGGNFTQVGPDGLAAAGLAMYTTCAGGCAADINGDGVLNVLDFVAFQLAWQAQEAIADCDDNGTYDILDFVCYQQLFVAGCD